MENTEKTKIVKAKPENFAFIIGAMKSGTTSLFDILSQHPQICASKTKEPDYFISDNKSNTHDDYLSLWDWQDHTHAIALESSVAYTKDPFIPDVPERIHNSGLGQYRFIYMLRNPLTRTESQVRHGLFAGWGKSLDEGIPDDAIQFSSYAKQLDQYLKYFPTNSIFLFTLEEYIESPDQVLSRVCHFLNIDEDFTFNDVKTIRNSGDFFNALASVSMVTQSGIGQFIAQNLLPAKVKTWIRDTLAQANKETRDTSKLGRWQLTDEEQNDIIRTLASDLKRLKSEFGVDIEKYWNIQADSLESQH